MASTLNRRSYHHGDLRDALVRGGLSLLVDGGVEALSLRAAARLAGVSPMAPYRHFQDKAALLAAIADHGFGELARRLATADSREPSLAALGAQGVAYVVFAVEHPALFRLMFGPGLELGDTPRPAGPVSTAGTTAFDIMSRRVATLTSPHKTTDSALICWSFVHGLASLILDRRIAEIGDRDAVERTAQRLVGTVITGIVTEGQASK